MPLELCPTSNVQLGGGGLDRGASDRVLSNLRFRVTVNTDNRLMSNTSVSKELTQLVEAFGWAWATSSG